MKQHSTFWKPLTVYKKQIIRELIESKQKNVYVISILCQYKLYVSGAKLIIRFINWCWNFFKNIKNTQLNIFNELKCFLSSLCHTFINSENTLTYLSSSSKPRPLNRLTPSVLTSLDHMKNYSCFKMLFFFFLLLL